MKKLVLICCCMWWCVSAVHAQSLHVDSTRFITGLSPATVISYALPTADKGILFTGYVAGNPGGIIPNCPYGGENVLIGKIDSNRQISWIRVYGGNDDDAASKACQTPDGGYAIIGGTTSHDGDVIGFKGGRYMADKNRCSGK